MCIYMYVCVIYSHVIKIWVIFHIAAHWQKKKVNVNMLDHSKYKIQLCLVCLLIKPLYTGFQLNSQKQKLLGHARFFSILD